MYFDEAPKDLLKDFYDREDELKLFFEGIKGRAVTIIGIRRIGKSSLVKVGLNISHSPYLFLDLRQAYRNRKISAFMLYKVIEDSSKALLKYKGVNKYLKRIQEISVGPVSIKLEKPITPSSVHELISDLMEKLNEWAIHHKKNVIVTFDEVQYLKYSSMDLRPLIAHIYDNLKGITLVFTGSEVGMLHDFLGVNDPTSPLYGRYMTQIELKVFTREKSLEFLRKGFGQANIKISENILEETVEKLDGVVGWLAFFGKTAMMKGFSKNIIDDALALASELELKELEELFKKSENYMHILRAISVSDRIRWEGIKNFVIAKTGMPFADPVLYRLLQNLQKMGFVQKINEDYTIQDPIIKYTAARFTDSGH